MARLIKYKATDDSELSTFIDECAYVAEEHQGSSKKKWWRWLDCCGCCESNLECDDDGDKNIEFSVIKETKVFAVCTDQQINQAY